MKGNHNANSIKKEIYFVEEPPIKPVSFDSLTQKKKSERKKTQNKFQHEIYKTENQPTYTKIYEAAERFNDIDEPKKLISLL